MSTKKRADGLQLSKATFSIGMSLLKLRSSFEIDSATEGLKAGKEPGKRAIGCVDCSEVWKLRV